MLDTIEILSGPVRIQGLGTPYLEKTCENKQALGFEMIRSYLLHSPEGDVVGVVTFFHIVHPDH